MINNLLNKIVEPYVSPPSGPHHGVRSTGGRSTPLKRDRRWRGTSVTASTRLHDSQTTTDASAGGKGLAMLTVKIVTDGPHVGGPDLSHDPRQVRGTTAFYPGNPLISEADLGSFEVAEPAESSCNRGGCRRAGAGRPRRGGVRRDRPGDQRPAPSTTLCQGRDRPGARTPTRRAATRGDGARVLLGSGTSRNLLRRTYHTFNVRSCCRRFGVAPFGVYGEPLGGTR